MSEPTIKSVLDNFVKKPGKAAPKTTTDTTNGSESIFTNKNTNSRRTESNIFNMAALNKAVSIDDIKGTSDEDKNSKSYKISEAIKEGKIEKADEKKTETILQKDIETFKTLLNKEIEKYNSNEKFEIFVEGKKMTGEFVKGKKGKMSYYLMYPEGTDPKSGELEFMTYLSGSGQSAKGETAFKNGLSSIGRILDGESLNMAVFAPVLPGKYDRWTQEQSQEKLESLLNDLKEEYNIDDKMALAGVSLGANGVLSISKDEELSKWFSKAIAISPAPCPCLLRNKAKEEYEPLRNLMSEESEIPLKIYYGAKDDKKTMQYIEPITKDKEVTTSYVGEYPTEHVTVGNIEFIKIGDEYDRAKWVTHTWAAQRAFDLDEDKDGKSDVLQWLYN